MNQKCDPQHVPRKSQETQKNFLQQISIKPQSHPSETKKYISHYYTINSHFRHVPTPETPALLQKPLALKQFIARLSLLEFLYMRLKEYLAKVSHVVHYFRTQGEVMESISRGKGETPGNCKLRYERAIEEVRDSLFRNKKLLGVFDQPIQTDEDRERVKEREIHPKDLQRHVVKSRYELRHLKPKNAIDLAAGDDNAVIEGYKLKAESVEEIVVQILTELTQALEINAGEIGNVFGTTEKELHYALFERGTETRHLKPTMVPPPLQNPVTRHLLANPPVPPAPNIPTIDRLPRTRTTTTPTPPPKSEVVPAKKPKRLTKAKLDELTAKAVAARQEAAAKQLESMDEAQRAALLKASQEASDLKDEVAEKIKALEAELRARNIIQ